MAGWVRSADHRALKLTCKHEQTVNQTDGNISGPEPKINLKNTQGGCLVSH